MKQWDELVGKQNFNDQPCEKILWKFHWFVTITYAHISAVQRETYFYSSTIVEIENVKHKIRMKQQDVASGES